MFLDSEGPLDERVGSHFADQKGEPSTLVLKAEHRPSEEEAARAIRSHLFPVMAELDLNDFQDRSISPLHAGCVSTAA